MLNNVIDTSHNTAASFEEVKNKGIRRCDRDKFNGNIDSLKRLWGV